MVTSLQRRRGGVAATSQRLRSDVAMAMLQRRRSGDVIILVAKHLMAWAHRPRRIYSLDAQALRPAEHLIFAARI